MLVVGAGGCLGRAVAARLRAMPNAPVAVMTSRSPRAPLYVDLAEGPDTWRLPKEQGQGGGALLLAALSGVAACENDPGLARQINVDGLLELARNLASLGFFLIFPSTSQVFDGVSSHASGPPHPGQATSPLTVYGRLKAEAETRLLTELPYSVAVLRMTKVLDPDNWLIRRWVADLLRGEEIQSLADMRMAPVSEELAAQSLLNLAWARQPGIFHLSASRDITYFEAARLAACVLGADPTLVRAERKNDNAARQALLVPESTALFVGSESLPGLAPGMGCPEPEAAVRRAVILAAAALAEAKAEGPARKERL